MKKGEMFISFSKIQKNLIKITICQSSTFLKKKSKLHSIIFQKENNTKKYSPLF